MFSRALERATEICYPIELAEGTAVTVNYNSASPLFVSVLVKMYVS